MECEFQRDLVDSCVPGDVVTLAGILKARKTDLRARGGQQKSLFLLYLDVNALDRAHVKGGDDDGSSIDMQFSNKDLECILEIAGSEDLFKLIVHSLCPAIYGHEIVKAGLVLALFGGRQKYASDRNKLSIRGDPHVLIVGDPGNHHLFI